MSPGTSVLDSAPLVLLSLPSFSLQDHVSLIFSHFHFHLFLLFGFFFSLKSSGDPALKKKLYSFIYFIEFIGVTVVNKIISVSGIQFYNSSSVYCIVCVYHPTSSFLPSPFIPPLPFHGF